MTTTLVLNEFMTILRIILHLRLLRLHRLPLLILQIQILWFLVLLLMITMHRLLRRQIHILLLHHHNIYFYSKMNLQHRIMRNLRNVKWCSVNIPENAADTVVIKEHRHHQPRKKISGEQRRLVTRILAAKLQRLPGVFRDLKRLQLNRQSYLDATALEFRTLRERQVLKIVPRSDLSP